MFLLLLLGVYLANDTYAEITLKDEEQRKEIQELILQKRSIEEERDKAMTIFKEMDHELNEHKKRLYEATNILQTTNTNLINTQNVYTILSILILF